MGIDKEILTIVECDFCDSRLNEENDKEGKYYTLYESFGKAMDGIYNAGWRFKQREVMCNFCIDAGNKFEERKDEKDKI